jgi:HSP20 family protein
MIEPTRRGEHAELAEIRDRLDRMFEAMLDRDGPALLPAVDVIEDDEEIVIRADVPGLTADDVTIEFDDDTITVSGEHEESQDEREKRHLRRERRYGAFRRSIRLPTGVDPDAIRATCDLGVLEVRIPRPEPRDKRTIEVTDRD